MNRLAASQKSSRTITTAWTCPPSHWRRLATSSAFSSLVVGVQPLLELVQNDQHLLARREIRPCRNAASESIKPESVRKSGHRFRKPLSKRASVSSAVAST